MDEAGLEIGMVSPSRPTTAHICSVYQFVGPASASVPRRQCISQHINHQTVRRNDLRMIRARTLHILHMYHTQIDYTHSATMASRQSAILDANAAASPLSIPASETALLLVDYQNMIVDRVGPSGSAAVTVAAELRSWAERQEIPVIVASVSLEQLPPAHSKSYARAGGLVELIKTNPELGEVHPDVANTTTSSQQSASHHVTRRLGLVSALSSDGIVDLLRRLGTRSLLVAGLSTSGCVLSTTRAASEEGYVVTVVEDACADPAQGVHEALVAHVLPMTANVVSLAELRDVSAKKGD